MSSADKDIDAAIQALAACKLFINTYASSEKAFDGIKAAADALYPIDGISSAPLRKGVADTIRKAFGPPNE